MRALLLALVIACGGGGNERPPPDTFTLIPVADGTQAELAATRGKLVDALAGRTGHPDVLANIAEVDGLGALLYGLPVATEDVFAPVEAGSPGYRSWVIGKVAFELTRVKTPEQAKELADLLDKLGKTHSADPWRRWLVGRVAQVRGIRADTRSAFEHTEHPIAKLEYALFLDEDGQADEGEKLIALADHPLAVVMRGLLRAELGNISGAVTDLDSVKSDAPRVVAYSLLARAFVGLSNQRYELAGEALGKLGKMRNLPPECGFWERVAWAHLQLGRAVDKTNDHKIASIARQRCATLGKALGNNHLLSLVDANLQLGLGRPDDARQIAASIPSPWGRITGAYAALELGSPETVDSLLAGEDRKLPALERRAANIVMLQSRAQRATGNQRDELFGELAKLAETGDQRGRHALGAAYYAIGDLTAAQRELRRVVEETSAIRPDPFAYRTHQLLAEIAIAAGDAPTAGREIDRAIAIHPGNATSRLIQARIQLRAHDPDRALESLSILRKHGELAPEAKLVVAEALVTRKDVTADQREQARALILEVVGKLPPAEVGRVAALVDPKLPGQLKLPVGKLPKQKT